MIKTYDIAAFAPSGSSAKPDSQLLWTETGQGLVVTGIVKLSQRFLLELLTVRGSMPYAPTRGSVLLNRAREGRIRSEIDAHTYFQYAAGQVRSTLLSEETADDPANERYDSVEILSVSFAAGWVSYNIKLLSLAGEARTLTLPLAVIH